MICLSDNKCDFNTLNQVNLSSNNEGAVPTWPWSCSSVIVQLLLSLWERRTMSKSGLWWTVNAIFLLNLLNYSGTQMLNVWFKFQGGGVKRQHQTLSLSKYSFMDWHMRMWSAPQIPHWWRTKCYVMNISAVSEKWWSDECFYEPLSSLLIQVCRDFIWTDVNSQHIAEGKCRALPLYSQLKYTVAYGRNFQLPSSLWRRATRDNRAQKTRQAALLDCWDFPQCRG